MQRRNCWKSRKHWKRRQGDCKINCYKDRWQTLNCHRRMGKEEEEEEGEKEDKRTGEDSQEQELLPKEKNIYQLHKL